VERRLNHLKLTCFLAFITILLTLVLAGCGSNGGSPPPAAPVSTEQSTDEVEAEASSEAATTPVQQAQENPAILEVRTEQVVDHVIPDPMLAGSPVINVTVGATDSGRLPISVTERTFLDATGTQVIEVTYIMPFTGDVMEVAPRRMLVNGVEFVITNVTRSQDIIDYVHTVERIGPTEAYARDFPQQLEYSSPHGMGVLELDTASIVSGVHNTTTETHGRSATQTFTMNIKDETQIPATVVSGGVTLRRQSVTWSDMGDGGQGRIFQATVRFSGTFQTSESDYIATANYVGRILTTNSPVGEYVVTYRPSTPVTNTSGRFSTDLQNRLYPTVDQDRRDWQEAQFRTGVEDSVRGMQTDIDELRQAAISMANTSQVMFMIMIIVLIILILGILTFVILKIKDAPLKGFRKGRRSSGATSAPDGSDDEL
jgi:hypothetical protein